MNKLLVSALFSAALLAACSDGVPHLDDVHHPVVDGQKMTGTEFIVKYCSAKPLNETCAKVSMAVNMDSAKGPIVKGW